MPGQEYLIIYGPEYTMDKTIIKLKITAEKKLAINEFATGIEALKGLWIGNLFIGYMNVFWEFSIRE